MAVAAPEACRISVIIPALNEANCLPATLAALQSLRRRGHEVIVVDGGSHDATVSISRPLVDRVLQVARGRALQMRAGAAAASGTVFWFLHADTRAPGQADRMICKALQHDGHHWGRFDIQLSDRRVLLRVIAAMMNIRSRLSGIATGDQGIFVNRELYIRVGGFPPVPLMEDIALSRALKSHGRPAVIRQRLRSSPRRWQKHGILRTVLLMWALRLAFYAGIPPACLTRFYTVHRA